MTILNGTSGADSLVGSTGNDTLSGGKGNDRLNGSLGNDLYTFSRGDGVDAIFDYDGAVGNIDTVQFLDVKSTEITAIYSRGSDLILEYGTADQLTVYNYFSGGSYAIEQFKFSDGITWDQATLKAQIFTYTGTAASEWIYGRSDSSNIIHGLAGDDSLQGGMMADRIEGGAGNDTLNGGNGSFIIYSDGNDTLNGGTGNDSLNGGSGSDLYTFSKGDGVDRIVDASPVIGNSDMVQFLDVKSTEITAIERQGNDLVLKYGTADQLTVVNYFLSADFKIELFKFSDGITWDAAALMAQEFTVTGTANNDFIAGHSNTRNHISGLGGNDTLYGAAMNDRLDGGTGNDVLMSFAGNDTLNGGTGSDFLDGGTGNDLYTFAKGDGVDTLYAYDATTSDIDTVQFLNVKSTEITAIEHQIDNDNLVLRYGTSDQLTLVSYFRNFDIEQFKFSDGVTWDAAGLKAQVFTLTGTVGNDSIYGHGEGGNRIFGLDGNDYLSGSSTMGNYVDGGNGNDTLNGGTGNDTLSGSAGDDSLSGDNGNDTLNGGTGHDSLSGDGGDDILNGDTGNDTLTGSSGNDLYTLARGDGMDTLHDFGGTTVSDIDTVQFLDVKSTEITSIDYQKIDYQDSHLVINYGTADRLTLVYYTSGLDIEQFKFSDGIIWNEADLLAQVFTYTGTVGNDYLYGHKEGGNRIYGLAGNDTLIGSGPMTGSIEDIPVSGDLGSYASNDTLNGGTGADSMTGGNGNDTYYVDNLDDVVSETNSVTSTGGIDRVNSYLTAYRLGANIENGRILATGTADLTGNELNNVLHAGAGSNVLDGGAGTDTVSYSYASAGVTLSLASTVAQASGGSGSDTLRNVENLSGSSHADSLTGSTANNTLSGGAGNDILNGGAGNDVLIGGLGTDKLTGGTGADRFDFNSLSELGLTNTTWDTIVDFKTSEGDKIDLRGVDTNTALVGDQAFSFLGVLSAFTGDATGKLRFDAVNHILYGSTDADTTAEFAIALTGVSSLSATDFVL